jgi:hypothetical protein
MIATGLGFQFFLNEAGFYKIGFLFTDNSWSYIMLSILSVTKWIDPMSLILLLKE